MSILARLGIIRDDRDPVACYVWSTSRGVVHWSTCPKARLIPESSRRWSRDPAAVQAACYRACVSCLGVLPPIPRVVYEDPIPERWAWFWSEQQRIAHRPTCRTLRLVPPESRRGTDDPEELARACIRGCKVCRTHLELPETPDETTIEPVRLIGEPLDFAAIDRAKNNKGDFAP